jgi:hypothetical protein
VVVALAGDHSYPDPDWAAALMGVHQNPWAAVIPPLPCFQPLLTSANCCLQPPNAAEESNDYPSAKKPS